MTLLVLSASDVDRVLAAYDLDHSSDALVLRIAQVFASLSHGVSISSPHRISIPTPSHNILFMPARISGLGGTAIKIVSVPAAASGLPASTVLIDESSGAVKAILNARRLTAVRTAAGSVLATTLVGPKSPHVLLAFGAGKQIEEHIRLLLNTFSSFDRCVIINRSRNQRLQSLRDALSVQFPHVHFTAHCALDGVATESFDLQDAVRAADVICTATSSTKPLFESAWVKPGTHLNLIGSYTPHMAEVQVDLIHRAGKVLVDSRAACAVEAGELINAGIIPGDMIEIGELLQEDGTPIENASIVLKQAGDLTIFKSVGVGLQDVAIASAIVQRAEDMALGTRIPNFDV